MSLRLCESRATALEWRARAWARLDVAARAGLSRGLRLGTLNPSSTPGAFQVPVASGAFRVGGFLGGCLGGPLGASRGGPLATSTGGKADGGTSSVSSTNSAPQWGQVSSSSLTVPPHAGHRYSIPAGPGSSAGVEGASPPGMASASSSSTKMAPQPGHSVELEVTLELQIGQRNISSRSPPSSDLGPSTIWHPTS
jgi:hypothetical protein